MPTDERQHDKHAPGALPADEVELRTLLAQERSALEARRRLALERPAGETGEDDSRLALPRVGLALSGGGVRSATFGLGLLRGLAQRGLLTRIDYLSTVSGGGFVGAMFGRLVTELGIGKAQEVLARSGSPVLDWLRRNGRYLTPAGARDMGIAAVTYLRAIIAIHGESLLICLPFLLIVILPHLLQQGFDGFDAAGWKGWHTLWWPLALGVWLLFSPGLMTAFWAARDTPNPNLVHVPIPRGEVVFVLMFAAVAVIASATATHNLKAGDIVNGQTYALLVIGANITLWSCLAGLIYTPLRLRAGHEKRSLAVARLRNNLTRVLRWVARASLVMALLGALDLASWWVLEALETGERWAWGGLGLGGLGVVLMRSLAQPLQQLAEQSKAGSTVDWGPKLLNLVGVLGLLALVLGWLALVQWLVFTAEPLLALKDLSPGVRALGLLFVGALWWVISAGNDQMANASSLHGFYRGRLTRAYLAVSNPLRGILASVSAPAKTDVTEVVPGDDVDLRKYTPEAKGGPIHLVNATLNQTKDDASGLYNADRKGTLVTATSRAFEIGPRDAVALSASQVDADTGTLGRWVAVSGAAASPGAGSYTSAGWAALLFFLGVRLGYWMRAPKAPETGWTARVLRDWKLAVKPLMLWSEFSATFVGRARPWWYLSDGGHFDNTGVYALLKRRLDFIILVDASADGDYKFGDIENLVRKARIDFGAEIEFYTAKEAEEQLKPAKDVAITVLSPESMADNHSARGVLMARVTYSANPDGKRPQATLLIVKPNLHDALDLDLLAYAQRHPTFPHESTGDQSFDEAQWESYHRLGEDFGQALDPEWLKLLPGWATRFDHPLVVATRLQSATALAPNDANEPLWRRSARATAIGATLGLGASGTLLLGLWQVSEQLRQNSATEQTAAESLFTGVSKDLRDFDGACPKVADHTATQLMMLRYLAEGTRLQPLEREGVGQLVEHVRQECEQEPTPSQDCAEAVQRASVGVCAVVNKPLSNGTALSYWEPTKPPRVTLASLFRRGPADVQVAVVAPPPASPTAPPKSGAPPAIVTRGGEEPTAASAPPAEPAPPPPPAPPLPVTAPTLSAICKVNGRPVQLYTQIYDEASRETAAALLRTLQQDAAGAVRAAPIENVIRSAELREQRRPVPWAQPTLIVHDPADGACAKALADAIRGALPSVPGRDNSVWVRELPRSLKARSGVIELWIPPKEMGARAGS